MEKEFISISEKDDLLCIIDDVCKMVKNSKLDPKVMAEIESNLAVLSDQLNCSHYQALLFSVIFSLNFEQKSVEYREICEYVGSDPIIMMLSIKDLVAMENMKILQRDFDGNHARKESPENQLNYFVPEKLFNCISRSYFLKNKKFHYLWLNELENFSN